MSNEYQIRLIISDTALEHSDSGEASFDRLARLIVKNLESKGYTIVANSGVEEDGIDKRISQNW